MDDTPPRADPVHARPSAGIHAAAPALPWPRTAKYAAEWAVFLAVAGLARSLPVATASALSGRLWGLVGPLTPRHRRALTHLATALPEVSEAAREAIAAGVWDNLGRTFAEALSLDRLVAGAARVSVTPSPALDLVLGHRGGLVLAATHTGNWELAALAAISNGVRLAGVYQAIKNPRVDAWVLARRAPYYLDGLYPKGERAARGLLRQVRRGGVAALLADLRDHTGPRVPFFGRPAPTNPFPAALARGVPTARLVCARVRRVAPLSFVIDLTEVEVPRTKDRAADVIEATARLQLAIEAYVREEPAQWMWAHKRWGRDDPPTSGPS